MRSANVRGKVKIKIGERPVLFLSVKSKMRSAKVRGQVKSKIGERPVLFLLLNRQCGRRMSGEKGQNKNSRAFPLVLGVERTIPIGEQPKKHPPKK